MKSTAQTVPIYYGRRFAFMRASGRVIISAVSLILIAKSILFVWKYHLRAAW